MSCCARKINYCVAKGETFSPVIRWGTSLLVSKAITAITRAAPAAVTAVGHGVISGWPVAVVSAQGMTQINASDYPPDIDDKGTATRVSADVITLDKVNSSNYSAYTNGGFLVYNTPVDLSAIVTAQFIVYDNAEFTGTPLLTLGIGTGITLDNTAKTIIPLIQFAAITWVTGYYRLIMTDSLGTITELLTGTIAVTG